MGDKLDFEAVPIKPEIMEKQFFDNLANGNAGVSRRIAFAFLGNSSDHYYESTIDEETGKAFLYSADRIGGYIKTLKAHIVMMEAAQARIFVALQAQFSDKEAGE